MHPRGVMKTVVRPPALHGAQCVDGDLVGADRPVVVININLVSLLPLVTLAPFGDSMIKQCLRRLVTEKGQEIQVNIIAHLGGRS